MVLAQLSTAAPSASASVLASRWRISPSVIKAPDELLELDDEELLELEEELLELDDELLELEDDELLELEEEELLELEDELLEIGWGGRRVSGTPCQPPEASQPVTKAAKATHTRAKPGFLTTTQRSVINLPLVPTPRRGCRRGECSLWLQCPIGEAGLQSL